MNCVVVNDKYEVYKYVLNDILQFPCTFEDEAIDRIHNDILGELERMDKTNIEHLKVKVKPLLQKAKEQNKKRIFAFNLSDDEKKLGRFHFPVRRMCKVISGADITTVLGEIRSWLCSFGDSENKYNFDTWGYHPEVGYFLNDIEDELAVTSLIQKIFYSQNFTVGKVWEPVDMCTAIWRKAYYAQVQPIEVELLFHEPSSVSGIKAENIRSKRQKFIVGNEQFTLLMPYIPENFEFDVVFDADFEYTVSKGIYVRRWGKFLTLGIVSYFDKTTTDTKVHRVKMQTWCRSNDIKLRDRIEINISSKSADDFMKLYQTYQQMETPEHKKQREHLEILDFQVLIESHKPWREFVQAMRDGGLETFNRIVKQTEPANLPIDIHSVTGIAFEELQIARIMVEAKRKNVSLELYKGDGQGVYKFNDQKIPIPEYVDAVFRNTQTECYYAVKFRFADNVEDLVKMMNENNNPNIIQPEQEISALNVENVKCIAPKGVVDKLFEVGQFEKIIDLGFKLEPLEAESVKEFVKNNKTAIENIVKSSHDEIMQWRDMEDNLRGEIELLDAKDAEIKKLKAELLEHGFNENINEQIHLSEEQYQVLKEHHQNSMREFDAKNSLLQNRIRNEMKKSLLLNGLKEFRTSAAVGAVTDGIISLVISGDTMIRHYFSGEATAMECALYILKETAADAAKGGAIGAILCAPEVIGEIAVNKGFATGGSALRSIGKIAGPALMIGIVGYSAFNILRLFNDGKITSATANKGLLQLTMTSVLSTGGMIAAGALVGGPLGIALGAGVTIAVTIGDYFLGEKISSLFIEDDHKATIALLKRENDAILDAVVTAAYKFLGLTQYATDDELKQNIKAARIKYHPDKGGDGEIYKAVHAAISVIKVHRSHQ